ncbi:MAG: hypothetical protein VCA73_10240 [Roseibacillus sp.]
MAESDSTAATPPALPPAPIDRVNDFSDKLSPMLVKELRQGFRTNTFVVLFLVLQGLLALVLLIAGPIAASNDGLSGAAGDVVSKIVFCVYGLGILVVQPLRGISAVATEIKQNTIDLMVLTRLSAWRIVWGKWCSIMSQSILIVLSILPYLIFRYFFGGMQLVAELMLMVYLFVISGTLTAFTVGMSATGSVLLRGLVVVGGSAFMMIYIPFYFTPSLATFVDFLSFTRRDESLAALGLLAMAVYTSYFFLEIGATAISPAAENRATRKRLIGLVVLVLSYFLLNLVGSEFALTAALIVAGLISLDLFTESPEFPSIVCRPFLRWGTLGRLGGRFLYPGWATGTHFFVLLAGIVTLLLLITKSGAPQFTDAAIGFGIMIFPAAMIQLFARNSDNRFSIYVTLMVVAAVLTAILSALYLAVKEDMLLWIFIIIPMVLFPVSDELASSTNQGTILFLSLITTGTYLLIVFAGAFPRIAKIPKLEAEALQDLDDQ